jgi:hypothetical protein
MNQTEELLFESCQVLERTEDFLQKSQPILANLQELIESVAALRSELAAHDTLLRDNLTRLRDQQEVPEELSTPLHYRNGAVPEEPEALSTPDWQPAIHDPLPSLSFESETFQLPWEQPSSQASRPEAVEPPKVTPGEPGPQAVGAEADPIQDRRAVLRRSGNPVSIVFTRENAEDDPYPAWVVDRSPQGLGLMLDDTVAVGDLLRIRPTNPPQECPWFELEVRHCEAVKGRWRVGCQFLANPSWKHLRYFG